MANEGLANQSSIRASSQKSVIYPDEKIPPYKASTQISNLVRASHRIFWDFLASHFPAIYEHPECFPKRNFSLAILFVALEEKTLKKRFGSHAWSLRLYWMFADWWPYHVFKNVMHLYVLTENFNRAFKEIKSFTSSWKKIATNENFEHLAKEYCEKAAAALNALEELVHYLGAIVNCDLLNEKFSVTAHISETDIRQLQLNFTDLSYIDPIVAIPYQTTPLYKDAVSREFISNVKKHILRTDGIEINSLRIELHKYFGVKSYKIVKEFDKNEQTLQKKIQPLQQKNVALTQALANKTAELQQKNQGDASQQDQLKAADEDISKLGDAFTESTLKTTHTIFEEYKRKSRANRTERPKITSGGSNGAPRPGQSTTK